MSEVISVLLIDDHSVVRQGVKTYLSLQDDIEVVAEAESGEQGVALAEKFAPDVVITDLLMPGGIGGVEVTRRIKQISPSSRIIVLTSYHQDEHIFPAIRAGALSYLLKTVDAADLAEAVRRAAKGIVVLHPDIAARVISEMQESQYDNNDPYRLLTQRELEILKLIAAGQDNADIAEALGIAIKTVRTHVSNVLSKLQLDNRTQAAVYAWRENIVD